MRPARHVPLAVPTFILMAAKPWRASAAASAAASAGLPQHSSSAFIATTVLGCSSSICHPATASWRERPCCPSCCADSEPGPAGADGIGRERSGWPGASRCARLQPAAAAASAVSSAASRPQRTDGCKVPGPVPRLCCSQSASCPCTCTYHWSKLFASCNSRSLACSFSLLLLGNLLCLSGDNNSQSSPARFQIYSDG